MLLKNSEWPRAGKAAPLAERIGWFRNPGRLRARVAAMLGHAMAAVAEWRRRRQTCRALAVLDDHMLKDLGLTRSDLPGWTEGDIRGWRTLKPFR